MGCFTSKTTRVMPKFIRIDTQSREEAARRRQDLALEKQRTYSTAENHIKNLKQLKVLAATKCEVNKGSKVIEESQEETNGGEDSEQVTVEDKGESNDKENKDNTISSGSAQSDAFLRENQKSTDCSQEQEVKTFTENGSNEEKTLVET